MRNLVDFNIPSRESLCVCEIDGTPFYSEESYSDVRAFTLAVETHPKICITNDLLHPNSSNDEIKSLFVTVDVPILKQLTQVYYEHGLKEALQIASTHKQFVISNVAHLTLNFMKIIQKLRSFLNPNLNHNGITAINEFSQTRNWCTTAIRCLSWHPHFCVIAVCTIDDSVRIYNSANTSHYLLRCQQQKNVTCLAWRPLTHGELAVGHEDGITVWNIELNSLVFRPFTSNATILYRINHKPVVSIGWSVQGNILVSAAACDKSILLWNVELKKSSTLKKPGGAGNIIIKWSPTGNKLFTASNGITFRVWDCQSWECEKWTVLSGRVQSACWTSCGSHILFATNTEPLIYSLKVMGNQIFSLDTESSNDRAVPLFDLTQIELNGLSIGGLVKTMEIDPKGNNLAVLFQYTNAIAIFNIAKKHNIELIASSVISEIDIFPTTIAFQQNFEPGACLTIGWSNGKVQHFPIIYTDLPDTLSVQNVSNITCFQSFNSL